MVSVPEWEYTYRWAQIVENGILDSAEMLQERDWALEEKLRENCGVTPGADPEVIQAFGPFSHPFDAAEYEIATATTLVECSFSGFTGTGPFLASLEVFVNAVSVLVTGSIGTGTTVPIGVAVVPGDIVRMEATITSGTVTECTASIITTGLDPTETIGWDA